MKRALLAAMLSWVLCGSAQAEDPVYFPDARLKAEVEDALWLWDPTPTDMLELTSLGAASEGIANLGGLEYAVNLQTLVLRWNRITDISSLSTLTNLRYLDIHDNQISDLSPLSGLSELRTLVLRFNRISDISALAGLRKLESLDLRGNPLNEDAFSTHLPTIVAKNPGIDLSYDSYSQCYLLVSSTAGGSVIRPGEGQFVFDNGLTIYLEARADPGYVFVGWSGSLSGSANPMSFPMDADHNVRATFARVVDPNIAAESVYFADTALKAAVEEVLAVSDPTPADMLALTALAGANRGITDVTGLEYAANLRELDMSDNAIGDISPLSALTALAAIDLRGNPLSQLTHDVYIPLILTNNPGIDLAYDPPGQHSVSIRSTLGGSVTQPGEGPFRYDDGATVLLRAQAEPGFVFVTWSGSLQSTANPTFLAVWQDCDIEAVFAAASETLYVDANAPHDPGPDDAAIGDPHEDGTREHPFDMIQEAIVAATDGATIVVRSGTYRETIDLRGKRIQLTGLDPNGAALPVIDGNGVGPVIRFTSGEDPNCMVVGFVVTGGRGHQASAIVCSQSSPVIANCLIVGNLATAADGAAVYCTDSNAVFVNCTIADNLGVGLMLIDSHIVLTNSIVWGNRPEALSLAGASKPAMTYCDIAGGWPDVGNIDTDPLFVRRGYWAEIDGPDALWGAGDYRLKSQTGRWDPQIRAWVQDDVTSPCIDAGDPTGPVEPEPIPNGGIVNLGTYGGTAFAGKSP
jgi:hypothetical protein